MALGLFGTAMRSDPSHFYKGAEAQSKLLELQRANKAIQKIQALDEAQAPDLVGGRAGLETDLDLKKNRGLRDYIPRPYGTSALPDPADPNAWKGKLVEGARPEALMGYTNQIEHSKSRPIIDWWNPQTTKEGKKIDFWGLGPGLRDLRTGVDEYSGWVWGAHPVETDPEAVGLRKRAMPFKSSDLFQYDRESSQSYFMKEAVMKAVDKSNKGEKLTDKEKEYVELYKKNPVIFLPDDIREQARGEADARSLDIYRGTLKLEEETETEGKTKKVKRDNRGKEVLRERIEQIKGYNARTDMFAVTPEAKLENEAIIKLLEKQLASRDLSDKDDTDLAILYSEDPALAGEDLNNIFKARETYKTETNRLIQEADRYIQMYNIYKNYGQIEEMKTAHTEYRNILKGVGVRKTQLDIMDSQITYHQGMKGLMDIGFGNAARINAVLTKTTGQNVEAIIRTDGLIDLEINGKLADKYKGLDSTEFHNKVRPLIDATYRAQQAATKLEYAKLLFEAQIDMKKDQNKARAEFQKVNLEKAWDAYIEGIKGKKTQIAFDTNNGQVLVYDSGKYYEIKAITNVLGEPQLQRVEIGGGGYSADAFKSNLPLAGG